MIEEQKKEKLGGFVFWFVAGLGMVKDFVIDPLTDLMIAGGLGISATGVGMLVGLPFAGFAWAIKVLYFASFFVIQLYYFWTHGGIHESIKLQRMVIWGVGFFTEWIPILDDLPMTTLMFVAVAYLENKKRTSDVASRIINVTMRYAK